MKSACPAFLAAAVWLAFTPPVRAAPAKADEPKCAAQKPPAIPEIVEKLAGYLDAGSADLNAALGTPSQKLEEALLDVYCGAPIRLEEISPHGCSSARIHLSADGHVRYDGKGAEGSFCLEGEPSEWGPAVVGSFHGATDLPGHARCTWIDTQVAFALPASDDGAITLDLYADRDLAGERKAALTTAADVFDRAVQAITLEQFAAAITAKAKPDAAAELKTFLAAKLASASSKPGRWLTAINAAGKKLAEAFKEAPAGCGDAAATLAPLITSTAPSIEELQGAVRDLALASQRRPGQRVPYRVFSGQLPTTGRSLIALRAGAGTSETRLSPYEKQGATVFAYDLQTGTAKDAKPDVVWTGKTGSAEANTDVAKAIAALVHIALAGLTAGTANPFFIAPEAIGAERPVPAGCAAMVCDDQHADLRRGWSSSTTATLCAPIGFKEPPRARGLRALMEARGLLKDGKFALPEMIPDPLALPAAVEKLSHSTAFSNDQDCMQELRELHRELVEDLLAGATAPSGSAPSLGYTTRVLHMDDLEGASKYEVRICRNLDADACGKDTAAASLAGRTSFETQARPGVFSLWTELSVGATFAEHAAPISGYSFAKAGSVIAQDQLYRLARNDSAADHVAVSVLALLRPWFKSDDCKNRMLAGAGTSIARGTSGELFRELDLRAGYELTHAVALLGGASLRWIDVPANLTEGTVLAVPSSASVPTFTTASRRTWIFSLGIAVDTTIFAEVGKSVAAAFKGSPEKKEEQK